jgi:hypothetical protein
MLTGIIGDKEEKCAGKGGHKAEAKTEKVRITCRALNCQSVVSKPVPFIGIYECVNM